MVVAAADARRSLQRAHLGQDGLDPVALPVAERNHPFPVAVLQHAERYRHARLLLDQQALGPDLRQFAIVRAGAATARLHLERKGADLRPDYVVGLPGQLVAVRDERPCQALGVGITVDDLAFRQPLVPRQAAQEQPQNQRDSRQGISTGPIIGKSAIARGRAGWWRR